jgi:hypothetical protein
MVSSRDRKFVSVETPPQPKPKSVRQDTAACVSLSNSTMSKTVTAVAAPSFYARRSAEAAIYG